MFLMNCMRIPFLQIHSFFHSSNKCLCQPLEDTVVSCVPETCLGNNLERDRETQLTISLELKFYARVISHDLGVYVHLKRQSQNELCQIKLRDNYTLFFFRFRKPISWDTLDMAISTLQGALIKEEQELLHRLVRFQPFNLVLPQCGSIKRQKEKTAVKPMCVWKLVNTRWHPFLPRGERMASMISLEFQFGQLHNVLKTKQWLSGNNFSALRTLKYYPIPRSITSKIYHKLNVVFF